MGDNLNIQVVQDEVVGTLGPTPLPPSIPLQLNVIQVIIFAAKAGWNLMRVESLNIASEEYQLVFELGIPKEIEVIIAHRNGTAVSSWEHNRYPREKIYCANLVELDLAAKGHCAGTRWKEVGTIALPGGGKKVFIVAQLQP